MQKNLNEIFIKWKKRKINIHDEIAMTSISPEKNINKMFPY